MQAQDIVVMRQKIIVYRHIVGVVITLRSIGFFTPDYSHLIHTESIKNPIPSSPYHPTSNKNTHFAQYIANKQQIITKTQKYKFKNIYI